MDPAPNCAICNAPAYPECSCESERLQLAVKQAEKRAMDARLLEIRNWVISHAREHILHGFEHLTAARKAAHATYLSSLPYYSIYMQYSGHPPLHPAALAQLQAQISEAHAELKRGIDADWRASVLRYPEVLDYFYSLVELRLPDDRSPSVVEPPFVAARYSDRGFDKSKEKIKKSRKDRDRERGETASPVPDRRHSGGKYKRDDGSYLVTGVTAATGQMRRMKAGFAPPAPTPPIPGSFPYGSGYFR